MTSNSVVPAAFNAPASAVFAGVQTGDDLAGGITGGYGLMKYRGKVWAIQFHGATVQLMRDDGDGPRGSIDVVIVRANPNLSKTWYENGWQEDSSAPPDCASADGLVPDAGVPKKQSMTCANCPRNQWGTAPNGGKGKACGDHRRMAIVPLADLKNESFGGALLLRCPAASLQDMAAFDARYKAMGYPYFSMGVKIGFDPMESFPKFTFTAVRPLTDDEARQVLAMRDSPEVKRVVSEGSANAVAAAMAGNATPQTQFLEAPNGAPVAQVVQQPVQQAQQPVQQAAPSVQQTGFGATAPVAAQQPAQQAQQPVQQPQQTAPVQPAVQQAPAQPAQPAAAATRPAVQMTGFGATAPVTQEVTQQPATQQPVQQTVQQPQQAAPVQTAPQEGAAPDPATPSVSQFEGSLDERLAKLIGQ